MNRYLFPEIDWMMILPVGILVTISLITLFTLDISFFKSQFLFLIISIVAFLFFSQSNYQILKIYTVPVYILSIILLLIVLFLGIESRGAVRWVEILGFRIQFSEILKPFLAISFASYLSDKSNYGFKSLMNIFFLLAPIALLIFLQPDLGDALIYSAVVIAIVVYLGFPFRYFMSLALPLIVAFPFVWVHLHDYQRQRILTFLDPGKDPLGSSYNVIQSIIAVGSGMLWGKGFGQGTQSGLSFLPERHTDFIFATIVEQLGFIGALIILACFALILYRIYVMFKSSDDKFCRIFCVIVFFTFSVQIFVNIGMNIGIIPIVGVTLPFMSYGGSALLSDFIFLGFLTAINRSSKEKEVIEIK